MSTIRYTFIDENGDYPNFLGLTNCKDIDYADVLIFPPDEWQRLDQEGKGKIVEVVVSVREKTEGDEDIEYVYD